MFIRIKLGQLCMYFLCLCFLLSGCSGVEETSSLDAESGQKAEMSPKELYNQNCAGCHGAALQGVVGPSLEKIGSVLAVDTIANVIEKGKGRMPAQTLLSEDERNRLAKWLAEKQ